MSALAKVLSLSEGRAVKALREVLKREAGMEKAMGSNLPSFPIPGAKNHRGIVGMRPPYYLEDDAFEAALKGLKDGKTKAVQQGIIQNGQYKKTWSDPDFWPADGSESSADRLLERGLKSLGKRPNVFFADGSTI